MTDAEGDTPPCSVRDDAGCEGCELRGELICRFDPGDMAVFAASFLPFALVAAVGMIFAGQGIFLLGWIAYAILFFFVWEARVLCRHCPYWAGEGRVLRCHANYGVVKIWKFDPSPMTAAERLQFMVGALIFMGYPLPFLIIGGQYVLAGVALAICLVAWAVLWTRFCSRCVNLSCPLNHVPRRLAEAYLERNPGISDPGDKL